MTDRVEDFVAEFERVIDAATAMTPAIPLVAAARRATRRLGDALASLTEVGAKVTTMGVDELAALDDELAELAAPVDVAAMLERARALEQVIANGIVDGDIERLRAAMRRAGALAAPVAPATPDVRLANGARVSCEDCREILVGHRKGGSTSRAVVTHHLRAHERDTHGSYSKSLRTEWWAALDELTEPDAVARAGRYVFVVAD